MTSKGIPSRPAPPRRLPTSGSTGSGFALASGSGYETPMDIEGMPWPDTPLSAPATAPATAAAALAAGGRPALTPAAAFGGAGALRRARTDLEAGRGVLGRSGSPSPPPPPALAASVSARLGSLNGGNSDDGRLRGLHSPAESLNGAVMRARGMGRKVGWRDRIGCFQWTWFTMTMVRLFLVLAAVVGFVRDRGRRVKELLMLIWKCFRQPGGLQTRCIQVRLFSCCCVVCCCCCSEKQGNG